jgi:hypothetical protein
MVVYSRRLLIWWGLLFCCKLGSRRQLDYQFRDLETHILDNINRWAHCQQQSLPVNKTLSHFLDHVGPAHLAKLHTECVRRLIRNKVLDTARRHLVHALLCQQTDGQQHHSFAWITNCRLKPTDVRAIACGTGRVRSKIENQGFNTQKNSGSNLGHAYSAHVDILKVFYYLLQIAHLFLQMFEMGSLLGRLAREYGCSPLQLFGSLKNLASRLLDCLRYFRLDDQSFDPKAAARGQIRLCDSS